MMLVKVLQFGSNWWARFGPDPDDRHRYGRHAAYFNSAGLRCGNKVRRHWIVPGLIRFNGIGDFNPQFLARSIRTTFECSDLTFAYGGNRLLFVRRARAASVPDYYLVSLSSDERGVFDFHNSQWKSPCAKVIAVSRLGNRQEALLLLAPRSWVASSLGTWQLREVAGLNRATTLELTGAPR